MKSHQQAQAAVKRQALHSIARLLPIGIVAFAAQTVEAAVLYTQNFDELATASTTSTPGSFVSINNAGGSGWQAQGGTDGAASIVHTAGVDANGVGGSHALFATWDQSLGSNYTYNQYRLYGIGGAVAGTTLSQVQVSMDLFYAGSTSTTPLQITISNAGEVTFVPILVENAFTTVTFTLDQGADSGFDPTMGFTFGLNHNGGFGFDADNTVRVDNISITTIPEPSAAVLGMLALVGMVSRRRR